MSKSYITEAFKTLDILNEEDFTIGASIEGSTDELKDFIEKDEMDDTLDVIDPEAETEDDFEDSYVGKVILDCCVCHSKIYKNPEDVVIDEVEELANVGEECPYCFTPTGYTIVGEVAPFKKEEIEVTVDDEPVEAECEDGECEVKDEEEVVEESLTEAFDGYKVIYYLNTAGKDRRPTTMNDLENDWIVDEIEATDDLDAMKQAFVALEGDEYEDIVGPNPTVEDIADFFDSKDVSDGSAIMIAVKNGGNYVYSSGITYDDLAAEAEEVEDSSADYEEEFCPKCGKEVDEPCDKCKAEMDLEECDKAITEAAGGYQVIYYLNNATKNRRPTTTDDVENDYIVSTINAVDDTDAMKQAFEMVEDDDFEDFTGSEATVESIADYFDSKDLGDGSPFVIAVKNGNDYVYDSGITYDDLMMDAEPVEDSSADESLTEANDGDFFNKLKAALKKDGISEAVEEKTDAEVLDEIAGTLGLDKETFINDVENGDGAKYADEVQAKCCDTCKKRFKQMISESFDKVEIESNGEKIKIESEPAEEEEVEESSDDMIAPVDTEMKDEIIANDEEDEFTPDDEVVDFDIDDFDENGFDEVGESYLKETYENVEAFKTTAVKTNGNTLTVEGLITFKSGNQKPTQFVFEAKDATKAGNVRFVGENLQFSRGKKSFTLNGKMNESKLMVESLNYNYRAKDENGKSQRVYGTKKVSESLTEAKEGMVGTILADNMAQIEACATPAEVANVVIGLIPEKKMNEPKVQDLVKNLKSAKNLFKSFQIVTNFILKGEGQGVI